MTIYNILYAIAIALEIPFIYLFLKAAWPQKCCKSLLYKMTCSTLFVTVGFLSIKISGNCSDYAKLIFIGLMFGWIGDLLLHIMCKRKEILFVFGVLSFLTGHIFYIKAFIIAIEKYTVCSVINIYEAFVVAIILLAGLLYCKNKKLKVGLMIIPGIIYATVISLMVIKAISLGYRMLQFGMPYAYAAFAILLVGAVSFIVSDSLLVVINYSKNAKSFKTKAINIITYFIAQILLASSVLFIE